MCFIHILSLSKQNQHCIAPVKVGFCKKKNMLRKMRSFPSVYKLCDFCPDGILSWISVLLLQNVYTYIHIFACIVDITLPHHTKLIKYHLFYSGSPLVTQSGQFGPQSLHD